MLSVTRIWGSALLSGAQLHGANAGFARLTPPKGGCSMPYGAFAPALFQREDNHDRNPAHR